MYANLVNNITKKASSTQYKVILFIFLMYPLRGLAGVSEPLSVLHDTVPNRDSAIVKIVRSWQLPAPLKGITAMDFTESGKLACLSEEIGAIFIFDLESKEIEKQIPFGPPGDYEGLVLVRNTAYVACSDGRILEIENFLRADTPKVIEYGTHLTVNEHLNGVCHDRKNRRLLVAIQDDVNENFKGIYSFSLVNKRMSVKPAIRVDLRHRVFESQQTKKLQTIFQPSDLDINPITGQLYIIDGTRGQLLRMRSSESIRDLVQLDKNEVFQPEGITFTPSGEIYFASKGIREEPGMLLRVRIIN